MKESIDFDRLNRETATEEGLIRQGGNEAVDAARRLAELDRVGKSHQFQKEAQELVGKKIEKEPKFKVLDNAALTEALGESMVGKPVFLVMKRAKEKFGDKFPSIDDRDYLLISYDNSRLAEILTMQERRIYYLFIQDEGTDEVSAQRWFGRRLDGFDDPLKSEWTENASIILLE